MVLKTFHSFNHFRFLFLFSFFSHDNFSYLRMLGGLSLDKENSVSGWMVFPNFDGWNHFKNDNWLILKFYSIVKRNQSILPEQTKRDVLSSLRMTQTWKMHTELKLSVLNKIKQLIPCLQNSPTQKILLLHLHHVNDPVKIQTKKDNCLNLKMQLPCLLVSRSYVSHVQTRLQFLSAVPKVDNEWPSPRSKTKNYRNQDRAF